MSWNWIENTDDKKVAAFTTTKRDVMGRVVIYKMQKDKLQRVMRSFKFDLPAELINDTWIINVSYQRGGDADTLRRFARQIIQYPREIVIDFFEKYNPSVFVWGTNTKATATQKKRFSKYLDEMEEKGGYTISSIANSSGGDQLFVAYKR